MGSWGFENMDSDEAVEFYDNFVGRIENEIRSKVGEYENDLVMLELEVPPRLEILLALKRHVGFKVSPTYLVDLEESYHATFRRLAIDDDRIVEDIAGRANAIKDYFRRLRSSP